MCVCVFVHTVINLSVGHFQALADAHEAFLEHNVKPLVSTVKDKLDRWKQNELRRIAALAQNWDLSLLEGM